MSHHRHLVISTATGKLVVGLAVSAAALSACGTGINPQTYNELTSRDFKSQTTGPIALRNIAVDPPVSGTSYPVGSTVIVTGDLVNATSTPDAVTAASSSVAGSAQLLVDGNPVTSIPVPANGTAGTWAVLLTGTTKPLLSGQYITLTLTFEKAGRSQELQVPVRSGNTGLDSRTPAQDPYKSAE